MIIPDFSKQDKESKSFLTLFIERFENQKPIIFEWNDTNGSIFSKQNYVSHLFKHHENKYISDKNLDKFKNECHQLFETYKSGALSVPSKTLYIDTLLYYKELDLAISEWASFTINNRRGSDTEINQIIEFEQKAKRSIVNGTMIRIIASEETQLTDFGKRNYDQISFFVDNYIKANYKISFFEAFYSNYSFNFRNKKTYPVDYYSQFFENNKKQLATWKNYLTEKSVLHMKKDGTLSWGIISSAIINKAASILRDCENEYRLSINSKKIGEAWISETELYYKIKSHYKNVEVIQHGKPDWLGRQHFDIWIPSLKIAIEYHGKQHDEPINFFGGEKAFIKNQERDLKKKQKAKKHNTLLIEVRKGYKLDDIFKMINGKSTDK
jgi:hypothetical protein